MNVLPIRLDVLASRRSSASSPRRLLATTLKVILTYLVFALLGAVVSAVVVGVVRRVGAGDVGGFVGGLVVGLCVSVALDIMLRALRTKLGSVLNTPELEAFGVTMTIALLGSLLFLGARSISDNLATGVNSVLIGFAFGVVPLFLHLLLWDVMVLAEIFDVTQRQSRHS